MSPRVTGIGGVFFKARDPKALGAWYRDNLGLDVSEWGGVVFQWQTPEYPQPDGSTIWSLLPSDSKHFAPSESSFMINYRVDDLDAMVAMLRAKGCAVDEKTQDSEYGKFGWVMDPEGNRIELWQPPAETKA
ncbi:MAG: VOC family protein [Planctomycetota bacterium]